MRLSLKKGAHAVLSQLRVQEIRGISLVFREMWDTTIFNPSPLEGFGIIGNNRRSKRAAGHSCARKAYPVNGRLYDSLTVAGSFTSQ
jgi:hypothetical protein